MTITGTGFTAGAEVYFGTAMATDVKVVNATTIAASGPTVTNSTIVAVGVTVIAQGGQSAPSSAAVFSYVGDGPQVTNVQGRGRLGQTTSLVVDFDEALDASPTQNVSNYQVVGPGGYRVKVRSAHYVSDTVIGRFKTSHSWALLKTSHDVMGFVVSI